MCVKKASVCALALLGAWTPTVFAHGVEGGGIEQAPVWITQALFLSAWFAYAVGAARRKPAAGARALFHSAMLTTGLALFGPLDDLAESSAAWHMTQHMLLIAVVTPLLVLDRPLPQWRAVLGGTLASAGALLFTAMHTGMLGALLVFAQVPLYREIQFAVVDQQMAGLLMWVPGGFVYLLVAVWAAARWLGPPPQPGADAEGAVMEAGGSASVTGNSGAGPAPGSGAGVVVSVFGPSTRQITLPTSSATSNAPLRSIATPTGRPSALPVSSRNPVSTSTGGPLGCASEKGT
jgi:hypothetical protein